MSASNTTSSATKYTFLDKVKAIGPAVVITGSFIGPGTITTATRTGADFGYDLLWTILFAIVATIVLQEMAARLGVVTRQGLSEAISKTFENNALKNLARCLVGVAIPLGCIAYMGGDLTGSAARLSTLTGVSTQIFGPLVGITILVLFNFGPFALIEKLLMVLVATMAVVFLVAVFAVGPNWSDVASGLIPSIPDGSMFLVLGLIGTTIVPYNFFVHVINAKKGVYQYRSVRVVQTRYHRCDHRGGLYHCRSPDHSRYRYQGHVGRKHCVDGESARTCTWRFCEPVSECRIDSSGIIVSHCDTAWRVVCAGWPVWLEVRQIR